MSQGWKKSSKKSSVASLSQGRVRVSAALGKPAVTMREEQGEEAEQAERAAAAAVSAKLHVAADLHVSATGAANPRNSRSAAPMRVLSLLAAHVLHAEELCQGWHSGAQVCVAGALTAFCRDGDWVLWCSL